MLIGLGGGAASSQTSVEESAELDFASVQRYVDMVTSPVFDTTSKFRNFPQRPLILPQVAL